MRVKDLITSRVCGNTVFENSWIWYCDECRHHGTAISSSEAHFMAEMHGLWNAYEDLGNVDDIEDFDDSEEVLSYMDATPEQRLEKTWYSICIAEGCMYIIDEGSNITYSFGEDYEDKTPNKVSDLDTMLKLQKDLGLE